MNNILYVDTETTGIDIFTNNNESIWKKTSKEELLSISVLDDNGKCLFNSLIKPQKRTSWEVAQKINGISPDMVQNAPFFEEVKEELKLIFKNKVLVIYNWAFDCFFLGSVLGEVKAIYCCMKEFCNYYYPKIEHEVPYPKHYKLINAVKYVNPTFKYNAHDSLEDCRATREVWHYLLQQKEINIDDHKKEFVQQYDLLNKD